VGEKMGLINDRSGPKVSHVTFGIVKGSEGRKLSSRDGTDLTLESLLEQAVVEAKKVFQTAHGNSSSSSLFFSEKNVDPDTVIAAMAYNAIKYFDMCHPRDYVFSFEHMLSFKGNTAVYLMYAFARLKSLRKNMQENNPQLFEQVLQLPPLLQATEEVNLALALTQFEDAIQAVELQLSPHVLCEYLYDLTSKFHAFYEKCRVMGDGIEARQSMSRMQLCIAVENILQQGFSLLGLKTVDAL
jgi:arginyl-tRNA synthetase